MMANSPVPMAKPPQASATMTKTICSRVSTGDSSVATMVSLGGAVGHTVRQGRGQRLRTDPPRVSNYTGLPLTPPSNATKSGAARATSTGARGLKGLRNDGLLDQAVIAQHDQREQQLVQIGRQRRLAG